MARKQLPLREHSLVSRTCCHSELLRITRLRANSVILTTAVLIALAQFYAGVQLSSYYDNGGSTVTVSGHGYAANEVVTITAGTSVLGTVTTDAKGAFKKLVTVPYAVPGNVTITATGKSSKAVSGSGFTVAKVYNSVELKSYVVAAGQTIVFIGTGYFKGEPVVITSNRTTTSYTITAATNGTFTVSGYALPKTLTPSKMTLTITGTYSHTVHTITIYVTAAKTS